MANFANVALVADERVVALDVQERVLGEVRRRAAVVVLVHEIRLGPEGAQAGGLEHLPPLEELGERLVPGVDLELQLAERQRLAALDVRPDERGERLELPRLDVDLEHVDKGVAVEREQARERVHLVLVVRPVRVRAREPVRLEVRAVQQRGHVLHLGPELVHGEVVAPDAAAGRAREQLGLERGLVVDADGVHDAVGLGCDAREAAHPLAAVAERADALDLVRAVEGRGEEVPRSVRRPRLLVGREPASDCVSNVV